MSVFGLGCNDSTGPAAGGIDVITTTLGTAIDPDGYLVTIDGIERGRVGATGQLTVAGLSAGGHSAGLADIAPNCAVSGDNPRSVAVAAGRTVEETFQIGCAPASGGA